MSRPRYIVWVKEADGRWEPNGDGPVTERQAVRMAEEIKLDCRVPARALPEGVDPNELQDFVELPPKQATPVYQVTIMVEITSDRPLEEVEEQVGRLLEYGTVPDSFAAADLDAAYFTVEKTVRKKS